MFFMVKTFECLAETTAADLVKDFVPKGKLVFHDNLIITSVIVKAKVVAVLGWSFDLGRSEPKKEDFWVVLNLNLLVIWKTLVTIELHCLSGAHWERRHLLLNNANWAAWLLGVWIVLGTNT